jgi:hypothetical protein
MQKLKHKLLFVILFCVILFASTALVFKTTAYTSEPTTQQKGLSILSTAAGSNVEKYEVTAKPTPEYPLYGHHF